MSQAVVRLLYALNAKEKFFTDATRIGSDMPEQFTVAMQSETARMGKVIEEGGIRSNYPLSWQRR